MIYFDDGTITVRSMTVDDIDAIINGFREQGMEKPRRVLELYIDEQNKSEVHLFMAEYNGSVAGFAALYPSAKEGPLAGQNVPEISDFNVFVRYRRKGIGNKILDAAEGVAFEIGEAKMITLGVGLHSGYGAAQRIYFKRGYLPNGSGVWYRGKPLDSYAECRNDDNLNLYLTKLLGIE